MNPCGRIVDLMRSCYKAQVAFFRDDPGILSGVQWYFVPETNPQLGLNNHFYSRIWERKDEPADPIGEQYAPVPWRGGKPPYPVSVGGLCGTEEQWANGALLSDPIPPSWPGTLIPKCCQPPPPALLGGIQFGGNLQIQNASGGTTGCMPCAVAPYWWWCEITGVNAALNGTYLLAYGSGCFWGSDSFLFCGQTTTSVNMHYQSSVWTVFVGPYDSYPFALVLGLIGTFNCLGENRFSVTVSPIDLCGTDGTVNARVYPA